MGNCFALRKDHETALKNFQRAVQLDSRFVYAHTLCGHEYVLAPQILEMLNSTISVLKYMMLRTANLLEVELGLLS